MKRRLTTKWEKLSQGRKFLLVAALLAFVFLAGFMMLIRPKHAEARALDQRLADLQTELVIQSSTEAAAAEAPKIRAADLFRLAKAMPDEVDMPGVLLQLNEVAADAGIVFKSISPAGPTAAQGYQVLPVELQFEGDFYGLSDFLYRLRNLVQVRDGGLEATGRLFSVEALTFSESEERFPQILASLTVNAFVYGTDAGAPLAPTGTAEAPVEAPEEEPATEATG